MLIEAKLLAQLQVTEAMLDSAYNTLHTEGTKRDGREFGGLYVGTHSGQYSLELTEMAMIDSDSLFSESVLQCTNCVGSNFAEGRIQHCIN
jgi:hypothetical protein